MSDDKYSDEERLRFELLRARPGIVIAAGVTAQAVETALAPVLRGQPVEVCHHRIAQVRAKDLADWADRSPVSVEVFTDGLICPQHPERLLCDENRCVTKHAQLHHGDSARCFVCDAPEVAGFTPVFGQVELLRQVPVMAGKKFTFGYMGRLRTYPFMYLCPRHNDAVDNPVKMWWPTVADDATPEDIIGR